MKEGPPRLTRNGPCAPKARRAEKANQLAATVAWATTRSSAAVVDV